MGKIKKRSSDTTGIIDREKGTIFKRRPVWVALGYPASYTVGASSLGFQTVYRVWNETKGLSCERFFYPSSGTPQFPIVTLESQSRVASANGIGFSIACETELIKIIELLDIAGISPIAAQRDERCPPVIIGGPITLLDPHLVAPLADVVVHGEGENALNRIATALCDSSGKEDFLVQLKGSYELGVWIPSAQAEPPPIHHAPVALLPAKAATWSPDAELKNLYLVEIARGCPRGCGFCVLSGRSACAGGFRPIDFESIIGAIPVDAEGVGLVGAAVSDHPEIEKLVTEIVQRGKRVSLSSLRADKVSVELLKGLKRGGLRTLTLAADGSSEELRRSIHKGITSDHLLTATRLAAEEKLHGIKLYSMVGLPGETDDDLDEFAQLVLELNRMVRISVAVQAFVPKPNTPLENEQMVPVKELKYRLERLKRRFGKKVRMSPTSVRWSWLDWKLAHGGEKSLLAALEAYKSGGDFNAWKRAVELYL